MGAVAVFDRTMSRSCLYGMLLLSCLAIVAKTQSSCGGAHPSKVKDCDHPDVGSCGNACCIVDVTIPFSPYTLYNGTVMYLQGGGDDGSFKYVTGKGPNGVDPSDDLTKANIDYKYIFQGTHKTIGGFIDTIDFTIQSEHNGTAATMRAASRSGIHGALGDNGQNYKTLAFMKAHLAPEAVVTIVYGCGKEVTSLTE